MCALLGTAQTQHQQNTYRASTTALINRSRQLLANCWETQRAIELHTKPTVMLPRAFSVVVVPGQNGVGTDAGYVQRRFEPLLSNMETTHPQDQLPRSIVRSGIPTHCGHIDFGQDRCKALLTEAMQVGDVNFPVVLYGNSQGTSTILQWLSDPAVDKRLRDRVVLVVLEAVMASGNSAIWHTVHNWYCSKPLRHMAEYLCLDALVCVLASWMVFRSFRAGDKQAVQCAESFPRHVPVIMTHARQDGNLCYNDACAILHLMRHKLQHPHAYLCTRMDDQHIDLYRANIHTAPAPNPRLSTVVQHVLRSNVHELPALFNINSNQPQQAEHPVDGAVTHAECYERVLRFDRKVHLCERVLRYAIPLTVMFILLCLLYYLLL